VLAGEECELNESAGVKSGADSEKQRFSKELHMKSLGRSIGVLIVAGAATAGGFFGFNLLENARFALAEQKVETTREGLSQVQNLSDVFRYIGKTVEPSVVNINVKKTIHGQRRMPFDERFFRRFFPDQDGDGQPDVPDMPPGMGQGQDRIEIGTGSGVIVEVDGNNGYIVTNNHVAGGATEMEITLADGRVIKDAKLVGADPKSDIAVVQITADHLIPIKWGDSDQVQKGDWVLAFGSPFGYVGSMTHGIVSALNRTSVGILGPQGYEDFIQVDAPINPGNSGGPLVNVHGEVIGINTAIATRSGGFQGIGFAIPSDQAKSIYQQIRKNGKVTRGWLGVSIMDVSKNKDLAQSFGYKSANGILVQQVFPNTPASGKLKAGDIIMGLNGKTLQSVQELRYAIAMTSPGDEATLKIYRDGKEQDVKIKLGSQPENVMALVGGGQGQEQANPGATQGSESLGLKLADPTDALLERFKLPADSKGALIAAVAPNSPAAEAGLMPGELISKVNNQSVTGAQDAAAALSKADLSKGVRMYLVSREGARFVFVKVEKK
jgi:serine protease Do